jgi:hypothetical protein
MALLAVLFVALVLFIHWLVTPTRSKPPRSQYTLPPLKVRRGSKISAPAPGQIVYWESATPPEPVSEETRKLYEEIYEKPRAEMERAMTRRARSLAEFGDDVQGGFREHCSKHHTKHEFVEAMVDSKPDESLSHSDRIEHDHGGSHGE